MGKSTAAWNMVAEVCLQGPKLPTVVFSTEMTMNDVARWMGGKLFEKDPKQLTRDEWDTTLKLIAQSPVTMCDAGMVTVDQIAEVVRRRAGTRLVIVDHIQRVNSGRANGGDNRNLEVGRTAQVLKSLAKDTGCTVLALSQMNRASDQLGRPRLSSLRDSGEIEQEADAVIFLWTQAEDITPRELDVEFYLAKNRHGALKQAKCVFDKPRRTFIEQGLDGERNRLREQMRQKERLAAMERGDL
jgi:replicative DNA helicase